MFYWPFNKICQWSLIKYLKFWLTLNKIFDWLINLKTPNLIESPSTIVAPLMAYPPVSPWRKQNGEKHIYIYWPLSPAKTGELIQLRLLYRKNQLILPWRKTVAMTKRTPPPIKDSKKLTLQPKATYIYRWFETLWPKVGKYVVSKTPKTTIYIRWVYVVIGYFPIYIYI